MQKTVLVTGSSRGIGKSILELFANNNYNVIVNYNNSKKEALKLQEKLSKVTSCLAIKADVSNDEEVEAMFKEISKKYKKIDVIINNAGIANDTEPLNKTKEDFLRVLEVNLYGVYNVSRYGYKYLNKNASIINISSTNGINTYYPYSLDYDASKAGVISISHNLANTLPNVRVNTVCPGWVETEMNKDLDKEMQEKETAKILLNRFAKPVEIANVCLFLASDKASYINDTVIKVDGGNKIEY